jgi:predicted nucleic acid-binding protein
MNGSDNFFVDSNVLLYCVDPVEFEKRRRAAEWMEALWRAGNGRLSWQVLHEFYWNGVKRMRLEAARAREMVEDLSHWRPVDTSLGLVHQCWGWIDAAQLTYWDALILAAAERAGARYLLSEDFQEDRLFGEIRVLNPFNHSPSEFSI